MKKEQFKAFLEENILPIFTGSELSGEEESSVRDALVAQGAGGSVLVKFSKDDTYRLMIKRIQPFKVFEISLIKYIMEELHDIHKSNLNKDYVKKFQNYAIEKAVCRATSSSASRTLFELIDQISAWAQRTYEGGRTSFGFLISNKKAPKQIANLHFSQILNEDFCALLSDGVNTCMEVSSDGYLLGYVNMPKCADFNLFAPYQFLKMANASSGLKIGMSLEPNGDILLFKQKALVFAKKNGNWISFSHEEIIHRLADKNNDSMEDIRKAIYLSALDTSFARTGGCIVHLNKEEGLGVIKHIDKHDLLIKEWYDTKIEEEMSQSFFFDLKDNDTLPNYDEFLDQEKCVKVSTINKIVRGRKFQELGRKLRQELLAIDGATIVDHVGNIVAAGAIIKIEAGSTGGGRLAATKTLSKYGMAIKISADGQLQGFRMDKQRLRVVPIFMM